MRWDGILLTVWTVVTENCTPEGGKYGLYQEELMNREEFLQRLQSALVGEVPSNVIEENMRYYYDYIGSEVRKGAREEDVTASIGDPRLIARTIIDATEDAREEEGWQESSQTVYEEDGGRRRVHFIDLSKWYWKLLAVVATVLFFFLVASIVTGLFSLLLPFMGPVILILLVLWFFRNSRR